MPTPSGKDAGGLPPASPYAAELSRARAGLRFGAALESEYAARRLADRRTLIRITSTGALIFVLFRVTESIIEGFLVEWMLICAGVVVTAAAILATASWSSIFERHYLSLARVLVPLRNALGGGALAVAAVNGRPEVLMVLPVMVIGPFFFNGLSVRAAFFAVVLTVSAYALTAVSFDMATPALVRSATFLVLATVAATIAARHVERSARVSFLERRLISELAENDALTGVKNRGTFDARLQELWDEAIERQRTIAMVLADVDHFKAYNDSYGHQAGDEVLRRVAQALQRLVDRPRDVLGRYGGEEFAAVLYDVDASEAEIIAERLRLAVKELAIEHRGARPAGVVTLSVGVALVEPSDDRRLRGALQLADQALYEAKAGGRDRVALCDQAAHDALVTGVFAAIRGGARR